MLFKTGEWNFSSRRSLLSSQDCTAAVRLTPPRRTPAAVKPRASAKPQSRRASLRAACSAVAEKEPAVVEKEPAVVEQDPVQATRSNKKAFASFDEMLSGSQTPILVDFYATWCGPCQLMSGVISEVAANFPREDKLQVVKIDIEKYPQLATRLRVQALPTLMLYRQGKQLDRIEGLLDAKMLSQRLRYYLRGLDAKFGRSQR